jgi:hypothetical protein
MLVSKFVFKWANLRRSVTGGALTMELRPAAVGEAGKAATKKKEKKTKKEAAAAVNAAAKNKAAAAAADDDDDEDDDDDDEEEDDEAATTFPSIAPPSSPPQSSAAAEKIEKVIHAHLAGGVRVPRSLRQLSGKAVTLGFQMIGYMDNTAVFNYEVF